MADLAGTQNQCGRRIKNITYREHAENPPDKQRQPQKTQKQPVS